MFTKESVDWLNKNSLFNKLEPDCFKRILVKCIAPKKDEDILIISDKGFEDKRIAPKIAANYFMAAKELGLRPHLVIQEPKLRGEYAEEDVIRALQDLRKENIIIMALSGKLGKIKGELGASFRTFAKENNHRFISSISLGKVKKEHEHVVLDSMDVDYREMQAKGIDVKSLLDNGNEVHITTKAGTDLYFNIERKEAIANTGEYVVPGSGGNIPAGEVYIAPRWKKVEGTVVIDGSSACKGGTVLVKNPIRLKIEKDEVVDIKGKEEAKQLRKTLEWAYRKAKYPWGIYRVGELGIGINPNSRIIGTTMVDEKTTGTAHIAMGSNYWFGGTIYAITHLDQVFRDPKIEIDDEVLKI
ncbi:hypothetical protein GF336_02800 [Candidatus Woesearchaeota archaeon]|nr:hypothetical protein [Candidatus Woesearchaeota archaeon]